MSNGRPAASLSIITVCRNALAEVEATAASVNTGKPDWVEYIVVDGASSDGTPDRLAAGLPGVDVYVSEPDSGLYDAMDKGVELASGNYVMFLNAGDKLVDTYKTTVGDLLKHDDFDLIVGSWIYAKEGLADRLCKPNPAGIEQGMSVNHQATLCRRDYFLALGGFDTHYSLAADYDFVLRAIQAHARIHTVDATLVSFAAGGLSAQLLVRYRRQVIRSQFIHRSRGRYRALVTYHLRGVLYHWVVKYLRLKR